MLPWCHYRSVAHGYRSNHIVLLWLYPIHFPMVCVTLVTEVVMDVTNILW